MAYDMNFTDTSNTLLDLFTGVNTANNFAVMNFVLLLFWLVIFMTLRESGTQRASITASAICLLLASLSWSLGWIAFGTIFYPVAVLLGSLLWNALSDSGGY